MNDEPAALNTAPTSMIKVVYFDEQSASDYLDISAGGSAASTSEDIRDRTSAAHIKVENKIAAKLSWLPFLGASAEVGGGVDVARVGHSILKQTLSNTILTDYLAAVGSDERVRRLRDVKVSAPANSMAFMKMFTPYMIIARTDDTEIDLARMDEALERAKGYYELLATSTGDDTHRCVLRFNIAAFRNNYGLSDLTRMRLTFHAVVVGQTTADDLTIDAEMRTEDHEGAGKSPTPEELMARAGGISTPVANSEPAPLLDVLDVLLAGVEHG